MVKQVLVVAVGIALTACGGGSNDTVSPAPSPTPTPSPTPGLPSLPPVAVDSGIQFYSDESPTTGNTIGLAVTAESGAQLSEGKWTQESGPDVNILADRSQVISFDAPEPSLYSFRYDGADAQGQSYSATYALEVSAGDNSGAFARLDHVSPEQGKVSLRVDALDSSTSPTITWTQTHGPEVEDLVVQNDNPHYLFFTAPDVNQDTLLQFEATLNYANGVSHTDTAIVLVKNVDANTEDGFFPRYADQIVTTDVFAYDENSQYANALVDCVYSNTLVNSCTFNTLPLIGQDTPSPSVDDVMARTVVSHQWMGDRFKEYLQTSIAGPDMLTLLGGVTAVVISYDVRPAFYWSATGAIYLDANNFWVTPEERDTLNDQPDYRSNFGDELQFFMPWRYVKDNQYFVGGSYAPEDRETRTFTDVEASVSWLLYHELAHANDAFPSVRWASISRAESPLSYINTASVSSDGLSSQYPLRSVEMEGLAQVSFRGQNANELQKNYTADDVTSFFTPDSASAYYGYLTQQEDFALLFEGFMMSYRFGASVDVGILSSIDNPDAIVTWGQRHRITAPHIKPRTIYAVSSVLPSINVNSEINALPAPSNMTPGLDWWENLDLNSSGIQTNTLRLTKPLIHDRRPIHWLPADVIKKRPDSP